MCFADHEKARSAARTDIRTMRRVSRANVAVGSCALNLGAVQSQVQAVQDSGS